MSLAFAVSNKGGRLKRIEKQLCRRASTFLPLDIREIAATNWVLLTNNNDDPLSSSIPLLLKVLEKKRFYRFPSSSVETVYHFASIPFFFLPISWKLAKNSKFDSENFSERYSLRERKKWKVYFFFFSPKIFAIWQIEFPGIDSRSSSLISTTLFNFMKRISFSLMREREIERRRIVFFFTFEPHYGNKINSSKILTRNTFIVALLLYFEKIIFTRDFLYPRPNWIFPFNPLSSNVALTRHFILQFFFFFLPLPPTSCVILCHIFFFFSF